MADGEVPATSAGPGRPRRRHVPVGALVVPASKTQAVKRVLEDAGWLKKASRQKHVHRYARAPGLGAAPRQGPPEMAVHVVPECAAALDAAAVAVAAPAAVDGTVAAGGGEESAEAAGADAQGCRRAAAWEEALPGQLAGLASMLSDGTATWRSGARIGDPVAAGGAGPGWHLSEGDRARLRQAGPRGEDDARAPADGFRFVELFAGLGGFRAALTPLGGRCVFACEVGEEERQTYFRNFGEYPASDITETPADAAPPHELLTAGFPCQPFTRAGLQGGFGDARGELFFEVVRFARHHRPAALLLENVPNLVHLDGGAALETILSELRALGYRCHHRLLSTRNVAPQDRLRLYIVGFLGADHHARFAWPQRLAVPPEETDPPPPTVRQVLEADADVPADCTVTAHQWGKLRDMKEGLRLVDRDGPARTLIASYRNPHSYFTEFVADEAETAAIHAGTRRGLTRAPRFFTVRECARLQGFPEDFVLRWDGQPNPNRLYHQLGNAVCPAAVTLIGRAIARTGALQRLSAAGARRTACAEPHATA